LTCFGDCRGEYTPSSTQLNQLDFAVHQISAGVDYIAVLGESGQLGVYGGTDEIGDGLSNTNPSNLASLTMGSVVANEVYVQVSTMNFAIYALKSDGTLHAWGKSYSYSVGGGGSVDMAASVPSSEFGQLYGGSAGVYAHYCALNSNNIATCWGADYAGQVSGAPTSAVSTDYTMPALLDMSADSESDSDASINSADTTADPGTTTQTHTTAAESSSGWRCDISEGTWNPLFIAFLSESLARVTLS
jgi:alpha-tubulin suppressor-like RCC1 family protein